jgi:Bacterial RNA polymerase, alpha chain C terminal domain
MRSRVRHSRGAALPGRPTITEKGLEAQPRHVPVSVPEFISFASPVEDLGLSVRTRNALRGIGCDTLEDLLGLDLSASARGLGRKTKDELLTALEGTAFRHPAAEQEPASEMRILERSLDRIESRVEDALGAVAKEIRLLKQRLRKVAPTRRD